MEEFLNQTIIWIAELDWVWLTEKIFIPILVALLAVRAALKRQAKNHQHQFQFKTYEEILKPIYEAQDKSGTYMAILNGFASQVSLNYTAQQEGYPPTDLKRRPEDYIQKHHEYLKSIGRLMKSLESILIIDPKLKIFITALSSVHWDISQCWDQISQATYSYLVKDLVGKNGENIQILPEPVTLEEKERIEKIVADMNEIMIDGTCYIMDLQIELQNLLLGEVYGGKKLKHRVPVAPKKRAISLENYEELKKHFKENHPLGQKQDRLIATIKEQLKNAA